MEQLREAFKFVEETDESVSVILAGDLNLRDYEVEKVGIPSKTYDVWEHLGRPQDARYTWDARRNSNIRVSPGKKLGLSVVRPYLTLFFATESVAVKRPLPPQDEV